MTLGQPPKIKLKPTQKLSCPTLEEKKVALAFLKTIFSTNSILSAPQSQDPEPNVYICVHFHLVNEKLTKISFPR
jgi:hypothetical protein